MTIRIDAEMKEEDNVRERHEDDFFRERVFQRVDGAIDQVAAIVERLDRHARAADSG